jgi:hypothetical protein
MSALCNWAWLNFLDRSLDWLSNMDASLNAKWSFGILASDYVEGTATTASFIYN